MPSLFSMFRPLTAESIAKKQLAESRIELLTALANREYYSHMCTMLEERIDRLETRPLTVDPFAREKQSTKLSTPRAVPPVPTLTTVG